jgi:acyl carrier protein phosphodiesterase
MNYLAHAYLSFNNEELLVGNMISDYIKGKKQYEYPPAIHKGIMLHRAIDTFTDTHQATKQAKAYFRAAYRLYAGAMVDVVYDHFLANDPLVFTTPESLQQTATFTYSTLNKYVAKLPLNYIPMLGYMQTQNWLYNYQYRWGIEKSLGGVVRRSKYLSDAAPAFAAFENNYDAIKTCYQAFFPELKAMALNYIG